MAEQRRNAIKRKGIKSSRGRNSNGHVSEGKRGKALACFNMQDLQRMLAKYNSNIVATTKEISELFVRKEISRIAKKVIDWLRHAAKNHKEAHEVLKLIAS